MLETTTTSPKVMIMSPLSYPMAIKKDFNIFLTSPSPGGKENSKLASSTISPPIENIVPTFADITVNFAHVALYFSIGFIFDGFQICSN